MCLSQCFRLLDWQRAWGRGERNLCFQTWCWSGVCLMQRSSRWIFSTGMLHCLHNNQTTVWKSKLRKLMCHVWALENAQRLVISHPQQRCFFSFTHAFTHLHTHSCTQAYTHILLHTLIHVYMHTYMHEYMYTHVHVSHSVRPKCRNTVSSLIG